jgi:hypothetical protein
MLTHSMTQTLGATHGLFERAAHFNGRPRERLLAMVEAEELCSHVQPCIRGGVRVDRAASASERPAAVNGRAVPPGGEGVHVTEVLIDLILEAVRCGDLCFPRAKCPEDLACTVCVLAFGLRGVMDSTVAAGQLSLSKSVSAACAAGAALDTLLDALAWKPLSAEWDYGGTRDRIRRELRAGV